MNLDGKQLSTGIVGLGYVGGAILHAILEVNKKAQVKLNYHTYDLDSTRSPTCENIEELVDNSDIIYIAVPTPMKSTGECDISIVESVVTNITTHATVHKILVIKSTIPPGTTELLQSKYPNHSILFSPEFLTEANYLSDFTHPPVLLIGKPTNVSDWIASIALRHQHQFIDSGCALQIKSDILSATGAELYKYIANTFLATKVSFANELSSLAQSLGVSWNELSTVIKQDHRLGKSHWNVPGPDGHKGYGGSCFVKDLSALLQTASNLNVPTPILSSVWERNITIDRPERDWELLKGRAVSS